MISDKLIKESIEVQERLSEFGITRDDLIKVAKVAQMAKNDSVLNDPVNAAGTMSYILGTRTIRDVLLPKGNEWSRDRTNGVESTYNSVLNIKIIFQNVDQAARTNHKPKAISDKGAATERMISSGLQGYLFPEYEKEDLVQQQKNEAVIWYCCVSINADELCAELSCPNQLQGSQFSGFSERIFILQGDNLVEPDTSEDNDIQDFDPEVTLKIK